MAHQPRLVVLVAFDGVQLLDIAGPSDVLDTATRTLRGEDAALLAEGLGAREAASEAGGGYRALVATASGDSVRASGGVRLVADAALETIEAAAVDTLIVAGAPFITSALHDVRLLGEIERLASEARRTCSVCSGTFLLGAAGQLDGRRATTHWAACEDLAARFPETIVEPDRIFVRDGHVVTSAGVTAGLDLALALVEEDLGAGVALKVARWMVMFVQRSGGQSQFSQRLALPLGTDSPVRRVIEQIVADPGADHRVPELARRAALSERHLARVFAEQTRTTPGRFVERVRVEAARDLLERTRASLETVARQAGFGSKETMRRAFLRVLGVGPGDYRARFQRTELGGIVAGPLTASR